MSSVFFICSGGISQLTKDAVHYITKAVDVTWFLGKCRMWCLMFKLFSLAGGYDMLPSFFPPGYTLLATPFCTIRDDGATFNGGSYDYGRGDMTMAEVFYKFGGLVNKVVDKYGATYATNLIRGATGDFEEFIRLQSEAAIIMGHTHEAKIVRYKRADKQLGLTPITYVNTGTWIDDNLHTYVDIVCLDGQPIDFALHTVLGDTTRLHSHHAMKPHVLLENIPNWTCNPAYFHAHDGCDCNCGTYDPDCDNVSARIVNCGSSKAVRCNADATCGYEAAPPSWTCDPRTYNHLDGCHCGCGAYDRSVRIGRVQQRLVPALQRAK